MHLVQVVARPTGLMAPMHLPPIQHREPPCDATHAPTQPASQTEIRGTVIGEEWLSPPYRGVGREASAEHTSRTLRTRRAVGCAEREHGWRDWWATGRREAGGRRSRGRREAEPGRWMVRQGGGDRPETVSSEEAHADGPHGASPEEERDELLHASLAEREISVA